MQARLRVSVRALSCHVAQTRSLIKEVRDIPQVDSRSEREVSLPAAADFSPWPSSAFSQHVGPQELTASEEDDGGTDHGDEPEYETSSRRSPPSVPAGIDRPARAEMPRRGASSTLSSLVATFTNDADSTIRTQLRPAPTDSRVRRKSDPTMHEAAAPSGSLSTNL